MWDVQVFGGADPDPKELANAPIKWGTPYITLGDGEPSEPQTPIMFGPVRLETMSPGSLSLWGATHEDGSYRALHVMDNVWHVLFVDGGIEVEGVERRADGVTLWARWECTPASPQESA
jgi:hypothetical protein